MRCAMFEPFHLAVFQLNQYDNDNEKRIMLPHQHSTIEISYIVDGELLLEYTLAKTGETIQQTIYPYQFFIIRPDCRHCTQIPHALNSIGLELLPVSNNFKTILKSSNFFRSLPLAEELLESFEDVLIFNDTHNIRYILNGFQKFLNETQDKFVPYDFNIQLKRLLIEILRCSQSSPQIKNYNPYIKKAVTFIKANHTKNISAKDIASYLNVSVGYLQRLFRENMQCSINNYLNNERIRHSQYLITHTNYSLTTIASTIGYRCTQTFISNFHKFCKMSPTEFKKFATKKQIYYNTFKKDN